MAYPPRTFDRVEYRVLSRPMGISWAGWRSDTLTLQRRGWDLAVEHSWETQRYRLLMKHDGLELYAITRFSRSLYDMAMDTRDLSDAPIFEVDRVARNMVSPTVMMDVDFRSFQAFDAEPVVVTSHEFQSLREMNIFNTRRAEQVLVDKADMTVIEHLEAIKALQSDRQRELRQKEEAAPARDRPRLQLVAQLVHIEAAA